VAGRLDLGQAVREGDCDEEALLVPALALAGIGIADAATYASSVKATEVEFHIKLSAASAKAGKTTFTIKNAGHLAP